MSMEDAEQQGATAAAPAPTPAPTSTPESEPELPALSAAPREQSATQAPAEIAQEQLQPPPQFSARSVAPNEFQIFHGETPLGKRLTPSESAIVLAWAKSIDDSEA